MTKTASLAVLLWLSALSGGCSGDEADDGDGGGGETSSEPDPRDTASEPDPTDTPDDVAAPPADAVVTRSGLASKVLRPGTGMIHPGPAERVRVQYAGWTTDGELFDDSYKRGEPIEFRLSGVIRGWTEGVQLMVEGEKRRFWIPADLAYGENPRNPTNPAGALTFDIELLAILGG